MSYALKPLMPPTVGDSDEYSLTQVTQVMSSESLSRIWQARESSSSGATLLFYIWPQLRDRTAVVGNEYATAIDIGDKAKFKILVAPDAGRGEGFAPAILEMAIQGQQERAIIDIPNVPLQRWTAVAIVKQGRRFKIYINGKLATSYIGNKMPQFDDTRPMRIGDPRLDGRIGLLSMMEYPMSSEEIAAFVSNTSDGDGKPFLSSGSALTGGGGGSFTSMFCPGGLCSTPKKADPFEQWTQSYA